MIHHFLKTAAFIPDEHYDAFDTIDFDALYRKGIRLLMIDLDNTLIPYDQSTASEPIRLKFDRLHTQGFRIVLISNNKEKRLKTFCHPIGIPYVSSAKKPLKFGFKKALKRVKESFESSQVCVIGDQLMTDVFGAKRSHYYVVLVNPIKKKSEKWYTRMNRRLEKNMLNKINKKYPEHYRRLHLDKRNEQG